MPSHQDRVRRHYPLDETTDPLFRVAATWFLLGVLTGVGMLIGDLVFGGLILRWLNACTGGVS